MGFQRGGDSSASAQSPSADDWVPRKNRTVSDRASFAVPSKDPTSFYLCVNPVFFRSCGKIETFATAHVPEMLNYLLASSKLRIASSKFSITSTKFNIAST